MPILQKAYDQLGHSNGLQNDTRRWQGCHACSSGDAAAHLLITLQVLGHLPRKDLLDCFVLTSLEAVLRR